MHPFPPAADLSRFIGDEIAQIWLDPHGVRLLFTGAAQLYVEAGYEHIEPDGTRWTYDCDAASGNPVLIQRLLYQRVVDVVREDLRLTLLMQDGAKLTVFSEPGPFESGHIKWPDGSVAVF